MSLEASRCVVCLMGRIGVGNPPGAIAATVITHVLKTGVSKVMNELCPEHLLHQAFALDTRRFVDEARAIVAAEGR